MLFFRVHYKRCLQFSTFSFSSKTRTFSSTFINEFSYLFFSQMLEHYIAKISNLKQTITCLAYIKITFYAILSAFFRNGYNLNYVLLKGYSNDSKTIQEIEPHMTLTIHSYLIQPVFHLNYDSHLYLVFKSFPFLVFTILLNLRCYLIL
jgi:hypothetical protein